MELRTLVQQSSAAKSRDGLRFEFPENQRGKSFLAVVPDGSGLPFLPRGGILDPFHCPCAVGSGQSHNFILIHQVVIKARILALLVPAKECAARAMPSAAMSAAAGTASGLLIR